MRSEAITAIMLTLFLASMLSMAFNIAPVHATEPETASGDWTYIVTHMEITKEADGNTFIYGEDVGTWTGTLDGTSVETYIVVEHRSGLWYYYKGLIDFTGTVDGKSGTLVIRTVGKTDPDTGEWSGKWRILSGEGDLANLRGQGTFWGPSFDLDYSGQIHFEPD